MTVPAIAAALDLAPHPEGGWYRRTWTSEVTVETTHGPRPSATAILYLLDGVSRRHRVRSAELWCRHGGSPVALHIGESPRRERSTCWTPTTRRSWCPPARGSRLASSAPSPPW